MIVEVLREDSWMEFTIPPIRGEVRGLEAVRVTGRLRSTRGGANYNWCHRGFELPSRALYEPFVRLEFRGEVGIRCLGWHAYACLDGAPEGVPALSWGGTLVDAPACVWGREVIDLSFRKEREAMICAAREALSDWKGDRRTQGALTAHQVTASLEELAERAGIGEGMLEKIVRHPVRPLVLFNHALFVERVVGFDQYRLVKIGEEGSVVTSPDHPFEAIRLGKGVWLLSHPIPTYDRVD